ncbi:MAG: 2-C-methyl-D-erythritol 2,4-cyclodiphosphate synthase [Firmicutes bacterium]|nr:2-C-methyl-D-erythritol 2,4-cyclodiphosphate synthase [Bacillota bacterium]
MTEKIAVILAAAGSGSRMGGGVPKQYRLLGDAPVLVKAARAFCAMEAFGWVTAAVPAEDMAYCRELLDRYGLPQVTLTAGGATRQESVSKALKSLPEEVDTVLVHDAARPFVEEGVIRRVLESLEICAAAVPCVHPKSTIRTEDGTLDRNALFEVQTPQGFDRRLLQEAFDYAEATGFSGTDEAGVFEHYGKGGPVRITEGSYANYKITTPEDLPVNIRIGNGYDVHRLVPGRKLMLGCCEIPYEKGLLGHSDADVVSHAIADALLGAAALGDIGRHFPDNDPAYEGMSGSEILRRTAEILKQNGFSIGNVDATLIAQRPKIAPYAQTMIENTAKALGVPASAVSIKATTEEGLGFTGDGSAMACLASATVK